MIYTVTLSPSIDYVVRLSSMRFNVTNRTDEEEFYFGGKGINVSQVLGELDLPSTALGFIAGFTGDAIAQGIGSKFFPGKNPMQMPQFMLPAAVLTVVFTVPMTMVMTAVGLKMGGLPMSAYWPAVLSSLPKMLLAAYISVLIFLPLSMKLSGLDKMGKRPE